MLVGALNMGEYAYDFTGENVHDGPSRNPHDVSRMTGGSSGGSGGAVAGGLVPLALGSDTNGSIRVPSSLCGIFGLKPTYGRLTRARSFPFVASLDHLGPFARSTRDLALGYDAMQGLDADDPACVDRPVEPATPLLEHGLEGLRIAVAGGYFQERRIPRSARGARRASPRRPARTTRSKSREAARARAAAYVITATEGAALHLDRLRKQARDFDPAVRDRLIAGAMVPATLVDKAQIFRRWYREQVLKLFERCDAILAPATPCTAPKIGQQTFVLDGVEMPVRPNIGHLHPADLLHRPAGGGGAGAAAAAADRACRSSPRPGARTSPCASRMRWSRWARSRRRGRRIQGDMSMEIDLPEVVAEVRKAFDAYEKALVSNDVAALNAFFRDDARTIRYGGGENLYGYRRDQSVPRRAFAGRSRPHACRSTVITTYGREFAVASTLYERPSAAGKIGRQMQCWVKFPEGWRVVAAHVSLIDPPRPGQVRL